MGRDQVVPFAGTWIETVSPRGSPAACPVVPFAGTWIETEKVYMPRSASRSFPSRERGLKLPSCSLTVTEVMSFPSRERGLKHELFCISCNVIVVVPFAGTWIETVNVTYLVQLNNMSFPSRERGLKPLIVIDSVPSLQRRSLRGNVD